MTSSKETILSYISGGAEDKVLLGAMRDRHAVRAYEDRPVPEDVRKKLEREVDACNRAGNLHMSIAWDEPEAFNSAMAHYGKFSNVRNYLVIAGTAAPDLELRGGYYGERVVLLAQSLGLNTCWVAMTFKKRFVRSRLAHGEKLVIVVALGYGSTQGVAHRGKDASQVSKVAGQTPASGQVAGSGQAAGPAAPKWFLDGVEAALLAPTAINQQKFLLELRAGAGVATGVSAGSPARTLAGAASKPVVNLKNLGGPYSKVDLGIVKLHFELGAGRDSFAWGDVTC